MTRLKLAPSILSADFARLGQEIQSVEEYIDWVHLDVMDGHYVDNLTFGPSIVAAVRGSCSLPLHVHLMITDPLKYSGAFVDAGADRISFHPEVTDDPAEVIAAIKSGGAGVGLAVHPDRSLEFVDRHLDQLDVVLMMTVRPGFGGQELMDEVLPRISQVSELVEERGSGADIEVDGGVKLATVDRAVAAGGRILVAGTAIFDGRDPPAAARRMRARLDELTSRSEKT